jgi:hypothetical protein
LFFFFPRYLVYANGLCAAYSLASAFYIAVPRPATLSRSWVVFLLDQVAFPSLLLLPPFLAFPTRIHSNLQPF